MSILYDDEFTGPRYRYGLHSRPLSPGAVPKGFIVHSDRASDDFRHGTLDYPVKRRSKDGLHKRPVEIWTPQQP